MAKLTEPPDRIFLQFYGNNSPVDCKGDSIDTADITWAEDEVFTHDVEYVRVKQKRKKNTRSRK